MIRTLLPGILAALGIASQAASAAGVSPVSPSQTNLITLPTTKHVYSGSRNGSLGIDGDLSTAQSAQDSGARPPTRAALASTHTFPKPVDVATIVVKATADAEAPNLQTSGKLGKLPIWMMTRVAVEYTYDGRTWYLLRGASDKRKTGYIDAKDHEDKGDSCGREPNGKDEGKDKDKKEARDSDDDEDDDHEEDKEDHPGSPGGHKHPEFTPLHSVVDTTLSVNLRGVKAIRVVAKSLIVGANPAAPISKAAIFHLAAYGASIPADVLPSVTTLAATEITTNSAVLNATVNPNGSATTRAFAYGSATPPANNSPAVSVGSGTTAVPATLTLTGLSPHTQYFFAGRATNSAGTASGAILSFTTGNSTPLAANGNGAVSATGTATVNLGALASDADGDTLAFRSLSSVGGSVVVTGSSAAFQPNATWAGNGSFVYEVRDGFGGVATATVSIRDLLPPVLTQIAQPPVLRVGPNGTAALPNATALFQATDNVAVTSLTQSPAAGQAAGPGQATIVVTARDAAGNESSANVLVTVLANGIPVANAATADVAADGTAQINLSTIASDPDGQQLTFTIRSAAGGATTLVNSAASYNPDNTWTGTGSFTYRASDGFGGVAEAIVTIRDLLPPALSQTGQPASPIAPPGGAAPMPNVLGVVRATDNVGVTSLTQEPAVGQPTIIGANTVVVTAKDAAGNQTQLTLVVTVQGNNPPIAPNGSANIDATGHASIDLSALASDPDGQPLIYSVVNTSGGTSSLSGSVLSYTVGESWNGNGAVTYRATDPLGAYKDGLVFMRDKIDPVVVLNGAAPSPITGVSGTAALPDLAALVTATDNIGVVSITQAPSAGTQSLPGLQNIVITAKDIAGNSGKLTVGVVVRDGTPPVFVNVPANIEVKTRAGTQVVELPNLGGQVSATDNSGTVAITQSPSTGSSLGEGVYAIEFTATDPSGNTATASTQFTVVLGNQNPEATPDYAFSYPAGVLVDVLDNDYDREGEVLTLVGISEARNGTAVVQGGRVLFVPSGSLASDPGFFTYIVSDGELVTTGSVTVYDPPDLSKRYAGLLYPHGETQAATGITSFTFNAEGAATGSITRMRTRYSFTGGIGYESPAYFSATASGVTIPMRVTAGPLDAAGNPTITFSIDSPTIGERRWTGLAEQSPYNRDHLFPLPGRFTAYAHTPELPGAPPVGALIGLEATDLGSVNVTGKAGNDKSINCGTMILSGGRIPYFDVTTASGVEATVSGVLVLDVAGSRQISGSLNWNQPVGTEVRLPNGLNTNYVVAGYPYTNPSGAANTMLNLNSAGELTIFFYPTPTTGLVPVVRNIGVDPTIFGDEPLLVLKMYPGTGFFNGNVQVTPGQARWNFQGVVVQGGLNIGAGFMLGPTSFGALEMIPTP